MRQSTTRVAAHTSANDARYRGLTQKVGFDTRKIVESTWGGEQPIHLIVGSYDIIVGSYDIIMRTAYSVKKHLESENAGQTVQPFSIFCGTVMQIGNAKLIELCNRMASGKAQQELFFSQLASQPSNAPFDRLLKEIKGYIIEYLGGNPRDISGLAKVNKHNFDITLPHASLRYADELIANKPMSSAVKIAMRRVQKANHKLMNSLKELIAERIKNALEKGAIINRPIPLFLQDIFENPTERVLKGPVAKKELARSVLEHVKTRAPWVVKDSTVHDPLIRDMANEYDVSDGDDLWNVYLRALRSNPDGKGRSNLNPQTAPKPFIILPISLFNRNQTQENKNKIDYIFKTTPGATLVVDYEDAKVAYGLVGLHKDDPIPLPYSIQHISFVGERIESIPNGFLRDCQGLRSVDMRGLRNTTEIGDEFLMNCQMLASINLSELSKLKRVERHFLLQCNSLTSVDMRGLLALEEVGDYFLAYCDSLRSVDLTGLSKLEGVGMYFLLGSEKLEELNITGVHWPARVK